MGLKLKLNFTIVFDFLSVLLCSKKIAKCQNITPYQTLELGKKEQVAQMFDFSKIMMVLNRVISLEPMPNGKRKNLKKFPKKKKNPF